MTATTPAPETLENHHWALRELPTFPAVATQLLRTLNDESAGVKQLVDLLRADAAFSAEILRRANSAAYGLRSQVSSLQHGIMLLGFEQMRQLAMAVSMSTYLKPAMRVQALKKCWKHSIATAIIADKLARAVQFENDRAYTAGLLHDIGLFGLMVHYPGEYEQMLSGVGVTPQMLMESERAMFELDHCEAGACLAEQWRFPTEIQEAAGNHHQEPAPGEMSLTALIHWSGRLASTIGFELAGDGEDYASLRGMLPGRFAAKLPEGPAELAAEIAAQVSRFD